MVAAAALGDVVQQDREIERAARDRIVHHLAGDRQFVLQRAGLDLVQDADREQIVCSSTV